MQVWLYLKSLGIEEGRIFYVSKDDLRVADFLVELKDEQLTSDVFKELSILNEAWKKKIAPPVPKEKDWREKYCRWHKQCISQFEYIKGEY